MKCAGCRRKGGWQAGRHKHEWELAMASQVKPGQWISVKITALPKSLGGRKTMVRIFEKDRQVQAERRATGSIASPQHAPSRRSPVVGPSAPARRSSRPSPARPTRSSARWTSCASWPASKAAWRSPRPESARSAAYDYLSDSACVSPRQSANTGRVRAFYPVPM